ncbi:MAG: Asp-tRNA(Asn)/Glu-tRNA(Gln) amidotransferase GatCAB subunit B, partial [Elusimicrobia bacterium]|nr:Asp-tRNA(Asn)/Glu-tRNA(Gln) amidotransferase GatCAB subunit B [Elusimicrobiota bacterium]
KNGGEPKISANLITTELTGRLNAEKLSIKNSPIPPEYVAEISVYLKDSKISSKIAKEIIEKIWKNPQPPRKMIEDAGMFQVSDSAQIEQWAKEAIQENRKAADDFTNGNEKALAALVGLVMKKSKGKSNPQMTNSILKKLLKPA